MNTNSQPSISYTLFLYREELKRTKASFKRLNRTKISLTDKLISKSVRNLEKCSTEDLRVINRELLFKKKLKYQMQRIRQLEKLGMRNVNPNTPSTEL
ncbi:uncharacterized protein LOC133336014 [Musca vetustissima]|uniref:uncharacterized protein LOC133336014 n=1 Tax=Musca vetustissima TaxID=27455 RepID=UPI002AB63553|nr:uncharacterized protein LOC133336014 [Musca vetustissima]